MIAFSFWQLVWFVIIAFLLLNVLLVFIAIVVDMFRSRDLSGVAKAVWVVVLLVLPVIGSIIYLVARGDGMGERALGRSGPPSLPPPPPSAVAPVT